MTSYRAALESLLAERMKEADLDGATAVRSEIESSEAWMREATPMERRRPPEPLEREEATESMWEIHEEMRIRLIRGITLLNQRAIGKLEEQQVELTRKGELGEALAIRSFREELAAELVDLTGEVNELATTGLPPEPVHLLSEAERKKWKVIQGDWTFRKETLIGEGDSRVSYERTITPPFELTFGLEVEEGQRPRVHIGDLTIAHDGYDFALTLHPRSKPKKVHPYTRGRKLRIKFIAEPEFVEFYVNDRLLERREPGISAPIDRIDFRGGDGWSPGRTDYTDLFLLERSP